MIALLVALSICSVVVNNCINNDVCKKALKTDRSINLFNLLTCLVCIVILFFFILGEKISLFTIILGMVFGIVTALNLLYKMLALSTGPMHITILITTASMIIPTLSGVFFGEKFSIWKTAFAIILIGFIYLTLERSDSKQSNKKWFIYCVLTFLFTGAIGVLQKIHQSSPYKNEASGLLFVAFLFSLVPNIIRAKGISGINKLGGKNIFSALICGICIFAMNYINLKLSGILPSQVFFPLVNGSSTVLSCLSSVFIFKEKINRLQFIGLLGGIASLLAICLVP